MKFVEEKDGLEIIQGDGIEKIFDPKTVEVLLELEKTQQEFWNLDRSSANFISLMVQVQNAKSALELGTSNGYSAIWIANALKKTGGHLTTIEFWDNRLDTAVENFKKCGVNDIITTKLGSAVSVLEDLLEENARFDFVFIDANKSEYIKYFKLIDKMLTPGGIILADNITSHYKKVESFMKTIVDNKNYQSQLIDIDTGIMFSRKLS